MFVILLSLQTISTAQVNQAQICTPSIFRNSAVVSELPFLLAIWPIPNCHNLKMEPRGSHSCSPYLHELPQIKSGELPRHPQMWKSVSHISGMFCHLPLPQPLHILIDGQIQQVLAQEGELFSEM